MARKRYKPEEIVAKLRQVDVLVSHGQDMADAIRQIGVSEVTYYRWRQEFGGLKIEQVKRLKDLELENSRITRTAGVPTDLRRVAGCATSTGFARQAGATAGLKLTFKVDHSAGGRSAAVDLSSRIRSWP